MIIPCGSCGTKIRVPGARLGDRARCPRCKADVAPVERPMPIESDADFDALLAESALPVLVDFWAPWCGPCRMVAPELEKLARSRAGNVVVVKVNTDELPTLGSRYGITGIPTLALFRGGREVRRVSGAMPAQAIASQLGL